MDILKIIIPFVRCFTTLLLFVCCFSHAGSVSSLCLCVRVAILTVCVNSSPSEAWSLKALLKLKCGYPGHPCCLSVTIHQGHPCELFNA